MTVLPRVLSYPPINDYVDRLHGHVARLVHRDEDWPRLPHFHDPGWITAGARGWDVAHLHFTWEQYPVRRLREVLDAHARCGTPVVWTVHDLRNPHTPDEDLDRPYLDALAASAREVLTLTTTAADEVARRFGRRARVVPHPPVLTADEMRSHRRWARVHRGDPDRPLRVLLLAKSLRANLDWRTPMEVVRDWSSTDPPVHLDVHLHHDVDDAAPVLDLAATSRRISLRRAPRLSRHALARRVAAADVLLLPYAWGTHSGLLELATDLGVAVVASDVGHYPAQGPCHVVGVRDGRVRADDLHDVLCRSALGTIRIPQATIAERTARLASFHRLHAEAYGRLAAPNGVGVG